MKDMRDLIEEYYPDLHEDIKGDMTSMAESQALKEVAAMATANSGTDTLVPMTMKIISKLHENNPELRFVAEHSDTYRQVATKITYEQVELMAQSIGSDKAADEIMGLATEIIVEDIGKSIKEAGAKELVTECLVRSISTIAEKTMAPQLYVKLNYDLR